MWQTHYQTLLNSVKTTEHKERVLIETSETSNSSQITFTPMLNLLYFVVTVLVFMAHFCELIIRSLLIASLELLSTMSIVAY